MSIRLAPHEFTTAVMQVAVPICDEFRKVCRDKSQVSEAFQSDWVALADICGLFLAFDLDTAESALPGFQTLPQETIDALPEWLVFAQDTKCLDLIARCHDLSWLVAKLKKKTGAFIASARDAIDGYVKVALAIDFYQASIPCFTRLQRASQLARTIHDAGRAKKVQDAIQELLSMHASGASREKGRGYYNLLQLLKYTDDPKLVDECVKWCTEAANSCTRQAESTSDPSLHMRAGEYGRLKMCWLAKTKDQSLLDSAWSEVARSDEAVAEIYSSTGDKNPIWYHTAAHWMHSAIVALKKGKAKEEIVTTSHKKLLLLQKRSMAAMGRFVQTIDTTALAARARSAIEPHDDSVAALFELATIAAPPAATVFAEQLREVSPLEGMLKTTRVNSDGKSIGGRDGLVNEESRWGAMVELMSKCQQLIACGNIAPALEVYCEKFLVLETNVQLWVRTSAVVPQARVASWTRGLLAGFNGDWSLVIHLLPQQIEHALRGIFEAKGLVTSGLQRERQHEFDLNKLLAMKEASDVLGVDARLDLAACLAHPLGANLRNYMAHGILEDEEHAAAHSVYLWWLALRMVLLPYLFSTQLTETEA